MRVISGTHKSRTIPLPKDYNARPTTDFSKESLFNILSNNFNFDSLTVLDLFSGTGSISYEFASRGCPYVTAIEQSFQNIKQIKKIITLFKMDQISAIKTDAFHFLNSTKAGYDIIFADPPYEMNGIESLPDIIFKKNILNPEGWFILEHSGNHVFTDHLNFINHRHYGSVNFSFFSYKK